MIKPKHLNKSDKIAIVSLSSGLLGEKSCEHQLSLGISRLKSFGLIPVFMKNSLKGINYIRNHPEARAHDLKQAFFDDKIKGILCAIGGDDTYKILPYLLNDQSFIDQVKKRPKVFMGFSDTTNNHLMFYKLKIMTYYGPSFLSDFAELDIDMLDYTRKAVQSLFKNDGQIQIKSSPIWYEDRLDYSLKALHTPRVSHNEIIGYDVINGSGKIYGKLLGGCLESIYDAYTGSRYADQKMIYETYQIMPTLSEWQDKILFIETSEEKPSPKQFETYLSFLSTFGIFDAVSAVLIGKPADQMHYACYRDMLNKYARKHHLPMMCNLNFGHAYPRAILPYGIEVELDLDQKSLTMIEPMFEGDA